MRLPLVTRGYHDLVVTELTQQRDAARRDLDRAETRLFDLLYTREEAQATRKATRQRARDQQQERIDAALDAHPKTKEGGPHRTRLSTWAMREVERGVPIEDVEEKLRTWGTDFTDDDDDDTIAI